MLRKRAIIGIVLLGFIALEATQLFSEQTRFTSFLPNIFFKDNLHEVVPKRLYRSAEMSGDDLKETIRSYGIKTVIDLRLGKEGAGDSPEAENRVASQAGAKYIHVPVRGSRVPGRDKVEEMFQAIDQATPPVLVHCSSGTHRSGVFSALWLLDQEGQSIEQASKQLSMKQGFFRFERELKSLIQGHPTVDYLLWIYEAKNNKNPMSIREWNKHRADGEL